MEGVGTIEMSLRMGVWWLGDMRVVGAGVGWGGGVGGESFYQK